MRNNGYIQIICLYSIKETEVIFGNHFRFFVTHTIKPLGGVDSPINKQIEMAYYLRCVNRK